MRWGKTTSEEITANTPNMVALKCIDCGKIFVIPKDKPLAQTEANGHLWNGRSLWTLRHETREDWLERQADKECCPKCGVPHGSNPYTGCELEVEGKP